MSYLLDADVFIGAKRRHYGFDIAPGFWQWLEGAHNAGVVYTVQKVAEQLDAGKDDLTAWLARMPNTFRVAVLAADVGSLRALSNWVSARECTPAAKSTFLASADYYLVAQAHASGRTVVTHEQPAPDALRAVKIPDACEALGVEWITPFEMLRRERVRLVV